MRRKVGKVVKGVKRRGKLERKSTDVLRQKSGLFNETSESKKKPGNLALGLDFDKMHSPCCHTEKSKAHSRSRYISVWSNRM